MKQVRLPALIALAVVLAGGDALAQPATAAPDEKAWSFDASAYTYFVPDSREYVQPTIQADRGWLHLEARYNYEDLDTGSAWVGYNFSFGESVTLDLTPMVGGVFGNTAGIAPGYKASLSWRKLELYSESEYVFDTGNGADSFLYTWSELALAPVDWFRAGLVVQRTKVYQTDFDIQRGFLMGFSYKGLDVTTYVFNPGASQPTVVLGVSLGF